MSVNYKISITNPATHIVKVAVKTQKRAGMQKCSFFLPSWSPGSYLMREYARHIRQLRVLNATGEYLYFTQTSKNSWLIDWLLSEENCPSDQFLIEYEIYCHELTVRTSHVTTEHAYLHGPSYLIGFNDLEVVQPTIEFYFTPLWSKISTGLKDISERREHFIYQALDYDELLDCPVEIGCHQTDGFLVEGIPHELAFYGRTWPHRNRMKEHIKIIVEHIAGVMGEIPYERYLFLAHFVPGLYGGLEHANSTALQFDGTKLANRSDYVNWLALVSHEYFHTWNIKRIRPKELGPFDYQREAYTSMLWLAEGLTSLMDELFVYQCEVITLDEYLEMQKKNLNRYLQTVGRRFHSLEDSSFNAWIKLYRPDENSLNSTVSYYLKGGIVFWCLNVLLCQSGAHIHDLLALLWKRYKQKPQEGMTKEEVFQMIEQLGGEEVRAEFEVMVETTQELDLETYFKRAGLQINLEREEGAFFGFTPVNKNDSLIVKSVILDGPAYKAGLNAGDEIIAINSIRVQYNNFSTFKDTLLPDVTYLFTISRLGQLQEVEIVAEQAPLLVKTIEVIDEAVALRVLKAK